eukprot:6399421-Pyramimonas_sp.AAC.1
MKVFLGAHGGPSADTSSAINLGVDDGAGKARRTKGRGRKAQARQAQFRARCRRARKARQALGRHTRRIF